MKSVTHVILSAVLTLSLVYTLNLYVEKSNPINITYENIEKKVHNIKTELPNISNSLKVDRPTKAFPNSKTIVLEDGNSVTISGAITRNSMAKAMVEIDEKLDILGEDATLYLVMDTGGGSVFAGLGFIDYVKSLPNNVVTITKFAASMGFQIVQNMGTRFITTSGTLMSHRARGGVQGQFDGELESQYKWVKENIDRLDLIAADRMEITLEDYKELIVNEFWSNGFRSVNNKSADEVVNVRCGKSLRGTKKGKIQTMFGAFDVTVSRCPLISGIIKVDNNNGVRQDIVDKFVLGIDNPREFTKRYIVNGKYHNFIK